MEIVNQLIWRVRDNLTISADDLGAGLNFLSESYSFSKLPIGLSIKLICPDEDAATLFSSLQKNKVGWYPFVLMNFDNVSNLKIG